MKASTRVLFGPLAAVLLFAGIVGLGLQVPGYSQVRQTVSEIGEVGSPMRLPFTVLLFAVAASILVFASGLRDLARKAGVSTLAAWVSAAMAVSAAGVGYFSSPHPLHNVFGLSELVGYQAPLVIALTWRKDPAAKRLVGFSWIMVLVVWASIALNLLPMFRPPAIWPHIKPIYGLVQRALFAAWFGWAAGVGLILSRRDRN
jgi:hypothetical protein